MSTEIPATVNADEVTSWSDDVDVVVIGFGIAGGCAAVSAAAAGARVLVLERAAAAGGTTALAGGHFYLGGGTAVHAHRDLGSVGEQRGHLVQVPVRAIVLMPGVHEGRGLAVVGETQVAARDAEAVGHGIVTLGRDVLAGVKKVEKVVVHEVSHVVHLVIDGAIRNPGRAEPADRPDSMLDPDAIAATCLDLLRQPRSAWTWEVELRPWVETF